jgi:hypothetical protein
MSSLLRSIAALALFFGILSSAAQAVVVQIDSRLHGSYVAGGPLNVLPGTLAAPFNPVSLWLDAGVYRITNAATTGYYSGWSFNTELAAAGEATYVWHFLMAADGGNILKDVYFDSTQHTQAGVAALAGVMVYDGTQALGVMSTPSFVDTFTLSKSTLVHFYMDDWNWGLGDNYGGVALNVDLVSAPVPEPSRSAMLGVGALGLLSILKRRRAR